MLINCHAHTENSDGKDSLLDMAIEAKRLGHSAFVVTDHDHPYSSHSKNKAQLDLLKRHNLLDFPVIIGSEIYTPFGEMLLFGKSALKNWTIYKDHLKYVAVNFSSSEYVRMFREYVFYKRTFNCAGLESVVDSNKREIPHALILCHPIYDASSYRSIPDELWSLLDGFEVQNFSKEFEITSPNVVKYLREKIGGIELRNSDAHCVKDLGQIANEIEEPIKDEGELIRWLGKNESN